MFAHLLEVLEGSPLVIIDCTLAAFTPDFDFENNFLIHFQDKLRCFTAVYRNATSSPWEKLGTFLDEKRTAGRLETSSRVVGLDEFAFEETDDEPHLWNAVRETIEHAQQTVDSYEIRKDHVAWRALQKAQEGVRGLQILEND